jgi:hypothetical protein
MQWHNSVHPGWKTLETRHPLSAGEAGRLFRAFAEVSPLS